MGHHSVSSFKITIHHTASLSSPIQVVSTYSLAFAWMTLQLKGGGLAREFICLIYIKSEISISVAEDFLHLYLSFLTLVASECCLFACAMKLLYFWNIIFLSYVFYYLYLHREILHSLNGILNSFIIIIIIIIIFCMGKFDGEWRLWMVRLNSAPFK